MVVYNTGDINWIPPGIFKIACKIDITFFPFDEQNCFLKVSISTLSPYIALLSLQFGSWTYAGTKLNLQVNEAGTPGGTGFDMSEYMLNGEWSLGSKDNQRVFLYAL